MSKIQKLINDHQLKMQKLINDGLQKLLLEMQNGDGLQMNQQINKNRRKSTKKRRKSNGAKINQKQKKINQKKNKIKNKPKSNRATINQKKNKIKNKPKSNRAKINQKKNKIKNKPKSTICVNESFIKRIVLYFHSSLFNVPDFCGCICVICSLLMTINEFLML